MPAYVDRASQFSDQPPEEAFRVELLCLDNRGTYVLPFLCEWTADGWVNAETGDLLEADVVGWRERLQHRR